LLQMHIAEETTKFGLDNRDQVTFMSYYEAQQQKLAHIQLNGMMGMASLSDDRDKVSAEFGELQSLFAFTQKSYFLGLSHFSVLSMGMSNDYRLAIAAGANMVRIGSLLFGRRN